jgi:tryptophan synthase alpha chain
MSARTGAQTGRRVGVERIGEGFAAAQAEGRAALITYLTLGYPTPERSLQLVEAAVGAGADLVELGLPFSDPLADGPVIQRAAQVALAGGITVARCLELARRLREREIMVPLIFMGYYNPILAYGEARFCRACRDAGVDGLIVPDLPPEEAASLERECTANGLALIYLLAPTSTPERVQLVTRRSRGFVYLVSVAGITGPRERLPVDLQGFVGRVRAVTRQPLAVGFGISTPTQVAQVAALADGVVVGSALVRLAEREDGVGAVRSLVHDLRAGVRGDRGMGESLAVESG